MEYRDCSTENGFDYEYVCKNPRCQVGFISSMGIGQTHDGAMVIQAV